MNTSRLDASKTPDQALIGVYYKLLWRGQIVVFQKIFFFRISAKKIFIVRVRVKRTRARWMIFDLLKSSASASESR